MKLLIGLGNPGTEYARTRHNLGFAVIDHLAVALGVRLRKKFFDDAQSGRFEGWDKPVLFVKPLTYMNLSGLAVGRIAARHKIAPADVIVVADDVSLPLGSLRVRMHGGAGGHNGLKSVIEALGSQDFPRLRVGIGAEPMPEGDLTDFVLGEFSGDEQARVQKIIPAAAEALKVMVNEGVAAAMNLFNKTL